MRRVFEVMTSCPSSLGSKLNWSFTSLCRVYIVLLTTEARSFLQLKHDGQLFSLYCNIGLCVQRSPVIPLTHQPRWEGEDAELESKSEWAEEEGNDDSIRGKGRASHTFLPWFRTTEMPAACFGYPVEINTCFSRVEGYGRGCVTFMTLFAGSL